MLFWTVKPKIRADSTPLIGIPSTNQGWNFLFSLAKSITESLHLDMLSTILLLTVHVEIWCTKSWRADVQFGLILSAAVLWSTYFQRSFQSIFKQTVNHNQKEDRPHYRALRNSSDSSVYFLQVRHTRTWNPPSLFSTCKKVSNPIYYCWWYVHRRKLSSRTSWSIWSKPFAKSSSKILMTFLEPSVSLRIWWTRLSSAWVVEEPFNEPNWRVSSLVIMDLTSQSATNRSQIFARVGVSEIGRKSVLISVNTFAFWIEMTSAFFHLAGMEACWIDALKIEAIGKAGIDE